MFPRYPRHCSAFCIWASSCVFFFSSPSFSSFSSSSSSFSFFFFPRNRKEEEGKAERARPLGRLWRISPRRRFNIYPYERRLRNLSSPLRSTCQSFPPVSRVVCALHLTLTRALNPRRGSPMLVVAYLVLRFPAGERRKNGGWTWDAWTNTF